MSGLASVVSVLAKGGPEVVEGTAVLVKLGHSVIEATEAWLDGKGPEPAELVELPGETKSSLALARMERLAASGTGGA